MNTNEINPIQFGEMVADVRNLREANESTNRKLDQILVNQADISEVLNQQKGAEVVRRRQQSGFVTVLAAMVSAAVSFVTDHWRH